MKVFNITSTASICSVYRCSLVLFLWVSTAHAVDPKCTASGPTVEGFGYSVAALDDVTGDGIPDFVVGSPYYSNGAYTNCGRVTIVSGANCNPYASFQGRTDSKYFGQYLTRLADVDGDGVADFAVGTPGNGASSTPLSYLRVYSGASLTLVFELQTDPLSTISDAGDMNNDGRSDLIVTAVHHDNGSSISYVTVTVLSGLNGSYIEGRIQPGLGEAWGPFSCGVRDYDGDGKRDFIYQSSAQIPRYSIASSTTGYSTVSGGRICPYGVHTVGSSTDCDFPSGYSVGSEKAFKLGDVDHDGKEDFAFSRPGYNNGEVRILSGNLPTFRYLGTLKSKYTTQLLGGVVTSISDLDHDRADDIVVSAVGQFVEIFSGSTLELLYHIDSDSGTNFGWALSSIKDTNGDGKADFLVSDPFYNSSKGRVLLFTGPRDDQQIDSCEFFNIGPTTVCS